MMNIVVCWRFFNEMKTRKIKCRSRMDRDTVDSVEKMVNRNGMLVVELLLYRFAGKRITNERMNEIANERTS